MLASFPLGRLVVPVGTTRRLLALLCLESLLAAVLVFETVPFALRVSLGQFSGVNAIKAHQYPSS